MLFAFLPVPIAVDAKLLEGLPYAVEVKVIGRKLVGRVQGEFHFVAFVQGCGCDWGSASVVTFVKISGWCSTSAFVKSQGGVFVEGFGRRDTSAFT